MCVGIQKKTNAAIANPISIFSVVTATYPINAGTAPENPPRNYIGLTLSFQPLTVYYNIVEKTKCHEPKGQVVY